jgi:hypothetical protein
VRAAEIITASGILTTPLFVVDRLDREFSPRRGTALDWSVYALPPAAVRATTLSILSQMRVYDKAP